MLSYDFAKMNILEINEEKDFFLIIKRVFFTCVEFSVFFKTNSLKYMTFYSLKKFFLKLKPLMGLSDLMGFLVYVQDLYEERFNQWQVEAWCCV